MWFFIVFSGLLALVHLHIARRAIVDTKLPSPYRLLAWLGLGLLWSLIPTAMLLNNSAPRALTFTSHTWLGCMFYLWVFFALRDAAVMPFQVKRLASRLWRRVMGAADGVDDVPASPDRRVFLSRAVSGAAAVTTLGIGGYGMRSALGEITQPEVAVRLSRLPKALDGFRIAQLSDVHIGALLGEGFLRSVVEQTNRMSPDLIVITGDLVDGTVRELGPTVGLLSKLQARHGVCFVTGNHEYYSGADAWIAFLRKHGMRVLQNERLSIGDAGASFDLLGVPDAHARRNHPVGAEMRAAAQGRDPERELIVLAHQPVQFAQALEVGAGLQLSGHTHGGQVQPFGQLVALVQPYVAGLHRDGDSQIYVSRGTGFWGPPMRVAAPAEITDVRLFSG